MFASLTEALLRVDEVIVAQQAADKMDGIHRWQRALADRGSAATKWIRGNSRTVAGVRRHDPQEEERRVPCDHAAALRRWQRHGISRQAGGPMRGFVGRGRCDRFICPKVRCRLRRGKFRLMVFGPVEGRQLFDSF